MWTIDRSRDTSDQSQIQTAMEVENRSDDENMEEENALKVGEENIKSIVKIHFDLIANFFLNDTSFDYQDDINDLNNVSLLFMICRDDNHNYYLRLFKHNPGQLIHPDILFLKIKKQALFKLLVGRIHIKPILSEYKSKFAMVGSLGTGDFQAFNKILLNLRKVKDPSNIDIYAFNRVVIGWIRFQVFTDFTTLCFCEQVFYICILFRNDILPHNRWALLNPKKSQLLNSIDFIGLYGITGLNHSERVLMNKHIVEYLYSNEDMN